jgi:hypothetical protein
VELEAEKPLRCHGEAKSLPSLFTPTLAYSPIYHYYMEILLYTHAPIASVTLYHCNNGTFYSHPNFVIDCTITSLLGSLISAGVEVPQKGQQLCRFKGTMMLITMVSLGYFKVTFFLDVARFVDLVWSCSQMLSYSKSSSVVEATLHYQVGGNNRIQDVAGLELCNLW